MITHLYVADRTVEPDHRSRYPCLRCPLPRENAVHDVPAVEGDVSDRILGESEERE